MDGDCWGVCWGSLWRLNLLLASGSLNARDAERIGLVNGLVLDNNLRKAELDRASVIGGCSP